MIALILILTCLLLTACGGGGGGGGDSFVLVLEQQPLSGVAGTELSVLIVHAEDSSGTFLPGANGNVTIAVASTGTLPAGTAHGLGGTTTRPLVNGRARFDDIRLTGAALNYRLRLSGGGSSVVTGDIDIEPGAAFRVGFLDTLQTVAVGTAMPNFRVAILDQWGNLVDAATNPVSIQLGTSAPFERDVILHASGVGAESAPNDDAPFELIDCDGPFVLPPEAVTPPSEVDAMVFDDANTGIVWGVTRNGSLFTYDIFLGNGLLQIIGGGASLSQRYKGLYFDGGGDLWGLPLSGSSEVPINQANGIDNPASSIPITLAGDTVLGYRGTAIDPISGNLYAGAILASDPAGPARLLVIDGDNVANVRGTMSQGCATLATKFDVTTFRLFAVSPDGGATVPTLYEVNPLNAAMTAVQTLGNGTSGEAITFVFPAPAEISSGSLDANAIGGIATFADWRWNLLAQDVFMVATSPGLNSDTSTSFSLTMPDTSGVVTISSADQTVDEGVGTISFTIALNKTVAHDVVVLFDPNGAAGTATSRADSDLRGVTQVTIPAGDTQVVVAVSITDDGDAENDEIIDIRITGASMAVLGADTAHQIRITDND